MNNRNIGNDFSIIMPVYNEAGVIEGVIRDFYEKVVKKIPNTKLTIVEDGSTDGTKEILNNLNKEIPFILISNKERRGYTRVFKDSLSTVKTGLVLFSDSDGQHEPADVFKLLKEIDKNDIVSGHKFPRRDPLHRIVISNVYNFLFYLLFGLKMRDINSGFKLIKKKILDDILHDVTSFEYCVMSEFILRAYLAGYTIKEVPIKHYPRKVNKSCIFTPEKLPLIIIETIKDLFTIRLNYLRGRINVRKHHKL